MGVAEAEQAKQSKVQSQRERKGIKQAIIKDILRDKSRINERETFAKK